MFGPVTISLGSIIVNGRWRDLPRSDARRSHTARRRRGGGWVKVPSDLARILIVHLLATEARAMTTGEVVDAMHVGRSMVSHHLQILGETCFVHVERTGTQSWWRINDRCLACFPSAAELITGRLPLVAPWDDSGDACA